jgi:hypothetical protein
MNSNYTLTDNLLTIRVGDTLTLEDGSVHEAVKFETSTDCLRCSMRGIGYCNSVDCINKEFHFKQIK